jgi:branched-chain amino acid transport system substrate-binding protein
MMSRRAVTLAACILIAASSSAGADEPPRIPVLVPLTGFLALEGTSQRNGAMLALDRAPGIATYEVEDTGTSPEVAVNALERALSRPGAVAAVASMLGTQMLAMIPVADQYGVPLVTVSGTAGITELGSPNVFRFFPGDAVVKAAQARYVVEELGRSRPALIYQTTAYGQSGRDHLLANLAELGAAPVFEEGIDPAVKDLLPVLSKAMATAPDVILLQLHAGSTALVVRQAKAMGIDVPIVAGSAMHQPQTAALLEPAELAGVCAESGSSPVSGGDLEMEAFAQAYRKAFSTEPDAFALAQYDGTSMVLGALAGGATTPEEVRAHLAQQSFDGVAMTYRSDGKGNMAHDAVIICYDGTSRIPAIVKRYSGLDDVTP